MCWRCCYFFTSTANLKRDRLGASQWGNYSPFPTREGGWGVRFFKIRMLPDRLHFLAFLPARNWEKLRLANRVKWQALKYPLSLSTARTARNSRSQENSRSDGAFKAKRGDRKQRPPARFITYVTFLQRKKRKADINTASLLVSPPLHSPTYTADKNFLYYFAFFSMQT